jgi:hypothetical protein
LQIFFTGLLSGNPVLTQQLNGKYCVSYRTLRDGHTTTQTTRV